MKTTKKKQGNNTPKTAWKPGQSGNPNGRPKKGHSITGIIRTMMTEKPEIKRALGATIIKAAVEDKDMTAIRLIWNYLDGLPIAKQELSGKDGAPLGVVVLPEVNEKTEHNMATASRAANRSTKEN